MQNKKAKKLQKALRTIIKGYGLKDPFTIESGTASFRPPQRLSLQQWAASRRTSDEILKGIRDRVIHNRIAPHSPIPSPVTLTIVLFARSKGCQSATTGESASPSPQAPELEDDDSDDSSMSLLEYYLKNRQHIADAEIRSNQRREELHQLVRRDVARIREQMIAAGVPQEDLPLLEPSPASTASGNHPPSPFGIPQQPAPLASVPACDTAPASAPCSAAAKPPPIPSASPCPHCGKPITALQEKLFSDIWADFQWDPARELGDDELLSLYKFYHAGRASSSSPADQ